MFTLAVLSQFITPPFPCNTCSTSLFNMFWAALNMLWICFMFILKKLAKLQRKSHCGDFGKVVGFQHPNLLKRNSTISVFLEITQTVFICIFQNSYYMESLQIIDKNCSNPLVFFLNMAYIFIHSHRKWKDILSALHYLSEGF